MNCLTNWIQGAHLQYIRSKSVYDSESIALSIHTHNLVQQALMCKMSKIWP